MRYTRANVEEDKLYLASTAVVMSEVIKSIVCLAVLYLAPESRKRSLKRLTSLLNRELILNWRETAKLAFPAALYLIQVSARRVRVLDWWMIKDDSTSCIEQSSICCSFQS